MPPAAVSLTVTAVVVPVPKALVAPSCTVPLLIASVLAAVQLEAKALKARMPRPLLVTARAVPPSDKAPRFNCAPAPTVNVGPPVKVVAPKVTLAAPVVTLLPVLTISVLLAVEYVPSVAVIGPLPEVARSIIIVEFVGTVVALPRVRSVSLLKYSVPPPRLSTPVPIPLLFVTLRVPAFTLVVPL